MDGTLSATLRDSNPTVAADFKQPPAVPAASSSEGTLTLKTPSDQTGAPRRVSVVKVSEQENLSWFQKYPKTTAITVLVAVGLLVYLTVYMATHQQAVAGFVDSTAGHVVLGAALGATAVGAPVVIYKVATLDRDALERIEIYNRGYQAGLRSLTPPKDARKDEGGNGAGRGATDTTASLSKTTTTTTLTTPVVDEGIGVGLTATKTTPKSSQPLPSTKKDNDAPLIEADNEESDSDNKFECDKQDITRLINGLGETSTKTTTRLRRNSAPGTTKAEQKAGIFTLNEG